MDDVSLLVAGCSATALHTEERCAYRALEQGIPVLRVFDHPLSVGHTHIQAFLNWAERDPRTHAHFTAITEKHKEALMQHAPTLEKQIHLIGNPLHVQLEEKLQALPATIRGRQVVMGLSSPVVSVFLVGDVARIRRDLAMLDTLCANFGRDLNGTTIIYDVHGTVQETLLPLIDMHAERWEGFGVRVMNKRTQDEMILAADLVIADPLSTVVERACVAGVPVACLITETSKAVSSLATTVGHYPGAVIEIRDALQGVRALDEAIRGDLHEARMKIGVSSGLLPQPGGMQNLLNLMTEIMN